MNSVILIVPGVPAPQGSKRLLAHGAVVEAGRARVNPWRTDVRGAALNAMGGGGPTRGAVSVALTFLFPRPLAHIGRDGKVKPKFNLAQKARPDLDKLVRAVLDALTNVVYDDDSQVMHLTASKRYVIDGEQPGVQIMVEW